MTNSIGELLVNSFTLISSSFSKPNVTEIEAVFSEAREANSLETWSLLDILLKSCGIIKTSSGSSKFAKKAF